ncbi:fimbrial protein [Rahnella bonaserana]|uniref:Type 1 fimbrial protein n=1 Tax=Rahnella bonaserana TaxID=2816248 RepID=A0ABS6LVH9_9GAMM|nr:hypothetical protein [Rahnella bonaserana]MBU9856011.1 type 1 fimbrial protein [Rahnella bonaserana]
MKKNLLTLSLTTIMLSGMINTASAASVTFTGKVSGNTCNVDINGTGSDTGDVDMGAIPVNVLAADGMYGGTSAPVAFTLALTHCAHRTNGYSINFGGIASGDRFAAPAAMGGSVFYEIKDAAGNNIKANENISTGMSATDSSKSMDFTVNLIALNQFINQGSFNMPTVVNIVYN